MIGSASALTIDFTEAGWLGGTTKSKNFSGGVGLVTVTASGGTLNADLINNAFDPCNGANPTELACTFDGIGIKNPGNNDDEVTIGSGETLTVTFQNAQQIEGFGFLDLFTLSNEETESATWDATVLIPQLNPTTDDVDGVDDGTGNGYIFSSIATLQGVTSIVFTASGNANSDFALASIDLGGDNGTVPEVPLPAALPLFGTGLAVMGFIGWRRKRKATA